LVSKLNRTCTITSTVIKTCLDSNIFISALLFDGKPEEVLFMASKREIEIIISPAIMEEVKRNLTEKFDRPVEEVKKLIKSITSISRVTIPGVKIKKIKYLPDNKILEAALEGKVDYIITGDKKHLLPLKEFKGIPIVTPAQFVGILVLE